MRMEPFNLMKVFEEVIEYQEMQAKQKNIKLALEGKTGKAVKVLADRKQIMEVINNLINNSIRYGKEEIHGPVSQCSASENEKSDYGCTSWLLSQ